MMKIHPPPDPRYPYANLLQPVPLDLPSSITPQSATFPTQLPTYFPDSSVLDTDAFTTESRAHPTKADILKRHSISRSYWDDPSPETTNNATPPSVTGTTTAEVKNDASGSNSNAATPTGQPKASGRSGQKRRQKYTRTRTGCLCCRARRIKCDEGRPTCKRCMIAKKECQYPDPGEGVKEKSGKSRKHDSGSRSSSEASDQSDDDATRVNKRQRPTSKDRRSASPSRRNAAGQTSPDDQAPGASGIDYGWDASFIGGPESSDLIAGSSSSLGDSVSSTLLAAGAGTGEAAYDLAGQIENKDWGAAQGGAPMLTTPNFLLPWFPTAEERSLILHYCANAASLMMAIPSGLNPMLAINLPLALDSPRGLNPSADALRVALLGIGAIHQAFLLARSGVATAQTAAMFQYASTLRDTGKEMVRRAVRDGNGALTDAALGAGTALATIDIFFGGSGWMDNFALAKEMVALRGGPAEMLKRSEPKKLTDGVTVSPARLMLEILAIYETFSCLTTAQEPSLISDMWESWWLEGSRSTYEEHSVEKQFGMSRVMVLLFTRVTRLLARVSRSNAIITESGPASNPISSPETTLNASVAAGGQSDDPLVREARQLNRDVDAWIESLQLSTLEHERVQVGNRAYAYAMKILLLRMVFRYPRDDIRVQNAAQQVLQHCSWSTAALGMSIDLTWPAIIAGACMDGASRQWVLTLLEGFKSQCCFDIETAGRILSETWRRADTNADRSDWREVCDDLGLKVL
ncbi:hypothetical protein I316_02985 [Kwoniella heveanensis BCC8398]|uniref:Zn(2)-C6 fungal-type domain-containing protein n=1 Tax=Kwoniella heveanensis BCC8398 TaxID=1296120 RepID=A0A1B9GWN3_9TREE|nr:hypothetical protein I316_02985 [Kwoniella heveanensis BCC8398]